VQTLNNQETVMTLYCGIDLHSNNSLLVLLSETDQVIYQKCLANKLDVILRELSPYQSQIEGIAVESTFNWYWLVDGLKASNYDVHLVNTAAVKQYEGLKYTNDQHDARWLAHLLRLEILPEGYIYPVETRSVRDLLRKRSQLVRHRTMQILSIQNLMSRNTGEMIKGKVVQTWETEDVDRQLPDPNVAMAVKSNLAVLKTLNEQIKELEKTIQTQGRMRPEYRQLLSVNGIGPILGLTIMLETGDIHRFKKVGSFASYSRCVESKSMSNGKKKGEGNRKNGNKYLAWAFVEAAHFAVQKESPIKRFFQRKAAKKNKIVAIKAVAHKLARACYYVMRDQVAFDVTKAFA
jgi:transposase